MSVPVAIVGIGCRLPGADDRHQYWNLLCNGVDATGPIPADRADYRQAGLLGRIVRRGGFLTDVEDFDPYVFGLSPREAVGLDPQARLLLETAWRSAEDAGITTAQLKACRTGVFVGLCSDDYSRLIINRAPDIDFQAAFGASRSSGSGRVSYAFGLTGPSMTVDTACSSSLVSVHLAVRAIQNGDCDLAFAGGANVLLTPETTASFMRGGLLSAVGRCEAFQDGANGFVRSEGAGMVLLKPLERALADNDRIYAVVRGSSVDNDGHESMYMAPSVSGQTRVVRAAFAESGFSPLTARYVEAHGTGTRIGDPVEVEALSAALCDGRPADRPLHIGSCKANIGHLEAGAGVAGLIKAALAVYHGQLPPSILSDRLNETIPWAERNVHVQRKLEPWPGPESGPRVAGVNSFGITGTNAHVVLASGPTVSIPPERQTQDLRLLPFSARDALSLRELAETWRSLLQAQPAHLDDLCYTASLRRSVHDHRLVVLGRSSAEMAERLAAWLDEQPGEGVIGGHTLSAAPDGPVFVFSGIGSQSPGMGLELYRRAPAFRTEFDRVSTLFEQLSGLCLLDEIGRSPDHSRIDSVQVMQPALFAVQMALTALWRAWGVEPAAVAGHSLGEAAAACVAGAISLEDAVHYVQVRSDSLAQTENVGGMLALGLAPERAQELIAGLEDRVAIGVVTSPDSVVLSGDRAVLRDIEAQFRNQDVFCRPVNASVATHSPLMDPFLDEIGQRIRGMSPQPAQIPFYSTVTGTPLDGPALTPEYWVANIRRCVLFGPAMARMLEDGHRSFVEVSAHPLLLHPMQRASVAQSGTGLVVPTLRRNTDAEAAMFEAFSRLHVAGHEVNWRAHTHADARHADVPGHPFRRERFWIQDTPPPAYAEHIFSRLVRPQAHTLLPLRWDSAVRPGTVTWQVTLDPSSHPFLLQHVVGTVAMLPLATYIELAVAAAKELWGAGPKTLRNVRFLKGQFFSADEGLTLQLTLSPAASDTYSVAFHALRPGTQDTWELTCDAVLSQRGVEAGVRPAGSEGAEGRCLHPLLDEDLLRIQELHGFRYGPLYQGVRHARRGTNEYVAQIHYLPELRQELGFNLHPAFLDAFLQMPFVGYNDDGTRPPFRLPVSIEVVEVHDLPEQDSFRSYGTTERGEGWERYALWLLGSDGHPLITIRGLLAREVESVSTSPAETPELAWMYNTVWERAGEQVQEAGPGLWTILGDATSPTKQLRADLEAIGHTCTVEEPPSDGVDAILARIAASATDPWHGVVYLVPAPAESRLDPRSQRDYQRTACGGLLALIQAISRADWPEPPRLFVVCRGAYAVAAGERPIADLAPVVGLARVAGNELPALRVTVVDLGNDDESLMPLIRELCGEWVGESEVALRGGHRYVSRLSRLDVASLPRRSTHISLDQTRSTSYRILSAQPGVLENISLELSQRRPPARGEVEIRVAAGGLNFLDVLRSLAQGPAQEDGAVTYGMECSGVVLRVGEGVTNLRPGQRVLAMAMSEGCFQAHVTLGERFVFALPDSVEFADAATWLVAYQTAWYALHEMARIGRGESILIHAAAGGVGLAAVHVAMHLGCTVYATAGSPEKRAFLQQLGVAHVMNSRTLEFADELLARTGGRGVDVVLNSIAGEAIAASLSTLAMGGRFLEIGKRDIYANASLELLPFRRNLSYFAIDMLGLTHECEDRVLRVTREVIELLMDGRLPSLPHTDFAASDARSAFRYMAQSRQTGKVVITFDEASVQVDVPAERIVRSNATYLVTGGLTGLGLLCAQWLAGKGARRLILAGRRAPNAEAARTIETLRGGGVEVHVASLDVSDLDQVLAHVARWREDENALPLAGVIHAAGVLRDGLVPNLDWEQVDAVLAPKVYGTRNLATALAGHSLDFLVLFSSIASSLGSPGQGNYAAANAYLDAFSDAQAVDHPGILRINWGPWTGLGMLEAGGLQPAPMFGAEGIRPEAGLAALDRLLSARCSSAMVMSADWKVWGAVVPGVTRKPYFSHLRPEMGAEATQSTAQNAAGRLAALPRAEAITEIVQVLRSAVMHVLLIPDNRMDDHVGLQHLGLDSLMAVELGHQVALRLGVAFNVMTLLRGPSVAELAEILYPDLVASARAQARPAASGLTSVEIDALPDAEIDSLLSEYSAGSPN